MRTALPEWRKQRIGESLDEPDKPGEQRAAEADDDDCDGEADQQSGADVGGVVGADEDAADRDHESGDEK